MEPTALSAHVHDHDLALARRHAARAIGRAGLNGGDREDLAQEALFQLVRRIRRYDPDRGPREAFVARVVEHRCAARRDWRRSTSLDAEMAAHGGTKTTLTEIIADDDHARRTR